MTTPTICPKGWANFQHYKDRKPAWIKLHRDLLDNYDFHCLPIASKALAPCLWLLASEYDDGQIPADWRLIGFRLRMTPQEVEDAVTPLISSGFFVASSVLADRKQSACLEKERETEKEKEKASPSDLSPADADDQPTGDGKPSGKVAQLDSIPYQAVLDAYNAECGELFPEASKLTDKRRKAIKARWRADLTNPDERRRTNSLDYWRRYFAFCAGDITFFRKAASGEHRGDHAGWKPTFDFLMREDTWLGVREGKYE